MITAFDYEAQEWITGEPARKLLIDQALAERTLVNGPRGDEYLRFTGRIRADVIRWIDTRLEQLA